MRKLCMTGINRQRKELRFALPPGDLGYAPEQTDDLKRQILAALADPQCNGNIYLVGGSAGGTLALWCALDPAAGAVSGWNETARSHIKAIVSFSGPTQFCDWSNPGIIPRVPSQASKMTSTITLTSRTRLIAITIRTVS
jgi:pimeloyl-ACP methyl ester carboxylesterase